MKTHHWFTLDRHDDPPPPATPPADPPPPADPAPTEPPAPPADPKDQAAELEKWKALSRKNEERAKTNAAAAAKLAEIEAANQTETQKLQAKAEAAEKAAASATQRAVKAEVRSLADAFADREDAALNLGDLSQYVVKDGEVDTDAIKAELAKVLERKPHLAKPAGARNPAPDPSQGKGGTNAPTDFRTADKPAFEAELAKYGLRPRST